MSEGTLPFDLKGGKTYCICVPVSDDSILLIEIKSIIGLLEYTVNISSNGMAMICFTTPQGGGPLAIGVVGGTNGPVVEVRTVH
jgi:hypothetical protein